MELQQISGGCDVAFWFGLTQAVLRIYVSGNVVQAAVYLIQNQDFGAKKNSRIYIPTKSRAENSNF